MSALPADSPAVIFDLDGTLVDSLEDLTASLNVGLAALGLPPQPLSAVRGMIGDGARVLVARAAGPAGADGVDEILRAFAAHYTVHCLDRTALYPGLAEVLDTLVVRRWPIAVLSNKPHEFTLRCVQALLARWPVAAVSGAREGLPRKPDPAGALEVARTVGRDPAGMYLVGDSPTDVATAKSAGMIPVAVTWGYRDRELLEAAGPALLIDDPLQLAEALLDHWRRSR